MATTMKIFNALFYFEVWYGKEVSDAADALERALYRYRTAPIALFWKELQRKSVLRCVRDLRAELAIKQSGQAQAMLFSMSQRKKGMRWA